MESGAKTLLEQVQTGNWEAAACRETGAESLQLVKTATVPTTQALHVYFQRTALLLAHAVDSRRGRPQDTPGEVQVLAELGLGRICPSIKSIRSPVHGAVDFAAQAVPCLDFGWLAESHAKAKEYDVP